ncbi:hypothetical protein LTR78_008161 [Recurvomyces mirabilis]|uniref:Uncharacterized protein n=2 Tax=Recurvomyces mirabilis TaxID=574656 RepID=A0AAE0WH37_9PEZI|nr:hypothetical protein LTR78_008161 [Recurvomyces mirabilis]
MEPLVEIKAPEIAVDTLAIRMKRDDAHLHTIESATTNKVPETVVDMLTIRAKRDDAHLRSAKFVPRKRAKLVEEEMEVEWEQSFIPEKEALVDSVFAKHLSFEQPFVRSTIHPGLESVLPVATAIGVPLTTSDADLAIREKDGRKLKSLGFGKMSIFGRIFIKHPLPGFDEKRLRASVWAKRVAREDWDKAFGDQASPSNIKIFEGVDDLPLQLEDESDRRWVKHRMWLTMLPETSGDVH